MAQSHNEFIRRTDVHVTHEPVSLRATGVQPTQTNCFRLLNEMYETAELWIQKTENALKIAASNGDTAVRESFEAFFQMLTTAVLTEIKSTSQQFIDYATGVSDNGEIVLKFDWSAGIENNTDCVTTETSVTDGINDTLETEVFVQDRIQSLTHSKHDLQLAVTDIASTSGDASHKTAANESSQETLPTEERIGSFKSQTDMEKTFESNKECDCEAIATVESESFEMREALENGKSLMNEGDCANEETFEKDNDCNTQENAEAERTSDEEEKEYRYIQCDICHKLFAEQNDFQLHVEKAHTNCNPLVCKYCNETFMLPPKFIQHLDESHPDIDAELCTVCSKPFERNKMITHLEEHIQSFKCDICDETFDQKQVFHLHRKMHKAGKSYICRICNKGLSSDYSRNIHEQKHDPNTDFICKICSMQFIYPRDLRVHVDEMHSEGERHICTICMKSYQKLSALKRHMNCHTNAKLKTVKSTIKLKAKNLKCDICSENFETKADHDSHYTSVHFFGKRQLNCPRCDSSIHFPNFDLLVDHLSSVHLEKLSDTCIFCDKHVGSIKSLFKHVSRTHLLLYKCDICGKERGDKSMLILHRRIHTENRSYPCSICGKNFSCQQYCKMHELNAHSTEKKVECQFCGERFVAQYHLRSHMQSKHNDNPHVCEHCGKVFPTKSALERHLFVHERHEKYQCSVCKKCYPHATGLRQHEQNSHGRTEGRWQCPQCHKVMQKGRKKLHLLAHSGVRPYVCEICDKSYAWPGLLREHKLTHKTDSPFQCKICQKTCNNSGNMSKHMKLHHQNVTA